MAPCSMQSTCAGKIGQTGTLEQKIAICLTDLFGHILLYSFLTKVLWRR